MQQSDVQGFRFYGGSSKPPPLPLEVAVKLEARDANLLHRLVARSHRDVLKAYALQKGEN